MMCMARKLYCTTIGETESWRALGLGLLSYHEFAAGPAGMQN